MELIDKSLNRGYRPGIVLIDSAYGNNTSFLKELEEKKLKYIGGIAKNRNIVFKNKSGKTNTIRIDEYAQWISDEEFKKIEIPGEKPRTVWVAIIEVEISKLIGQRKIAIVMSALVFEDAEDIDYLITNVEGEKVTEQWIVETYSERNWVEVFYREAKGWLGLSEYQVREKKSLKKHFILVFCAYTFILWHKKENQEYLEQFFWKPYFWNKAYGIISVGGRANLETLLTYIQGQNVPPLPSD